MDETELIAAAQLGNEDAFGELYRQHSRYVRAIGRSILRKQRLRRYVPGYLSPGLYTAHSFEGNSQFRTWITRIAINQCLITLRKGRQASNGDVTAR